jgi:tetratricopeptide (TPR) repeat protein
MRRCLISIALACLVSSACWGDAIVLKSGARLAGDVKRSPGGYTVTLPGGKTQFVGSDEVKSLEAGPTTAPMSEAAAKGKLETFRRSVESMNDPQKVVERYQKFVEQNTPSPIEADARQDLAMWQDRAKQGLVKFGTHWVAPQEKAALQEKALHDADNVRKLLRQGRLQEADSAISAALAEDPQNATVIYLRGLLQFRQDQIPQSRKSFELVNQLVPRHGPTLNNLAVILVRQNQNAAALNYYDQAMTASPKNRDILNNVAEMLYNMPDEQRQSAVAQKVLKKFDQQDVQLAHELETQGLHRWGSNWVTSDRLMELQKADADAKDKLDQLAGQFDAVQVRISNIDREMEENNRAMRRIDSMSIVRGSDGQLHQAGVPASYYDMQDDNRKLAQERAEQIDKLAQLREQAKAVNRDMPFPKYTGIQKLMDENSAPIIAPATQPATQPTTAPALERPPPKAQARTDPASDLSGV